MSAEDALVVFTPSGKRGRFPLGTPLLQAARSLGVDVDSVCGGRALCGRCQVLVMEGDFAKHGVSSSATHLSAAGCDRAEFLAPPPAARRPSPLLPGKDRRESGDRRAAGQSGASPGGAQGRRGARHHARSGGAPALRGSARTGHARPLRRPGAAREGARARMGALRAHLRGLGAAHPAGHPAPGCPGRSPRRYTAAITSSPSGRACTSTSTGSRSMSAPPPSPGTCATWNPVRSSPPAAS